MSRTLFKFSNPPDGLTRRVMFMERPAWPELSAKLESLYGIPKDNIGVSYVDPDGDEVTLSSDEELRDFYKFNSTPLSAFERVDAMKAIRFIVRNLEAARASEANKSLPQTPQSSHHRNTFGISSLHSGAFEGDDWQHISAFGGPPTGIFVPMVPEESPAPHAFLEVIESDASVRGDRADDASSITESDLGATPKPDKGKGRVVEDNDEEDEDVASTLAMVDEDAPPKPPVHVRNASLATTDDIFGTRRLSETDKTSTLPAQPEDTPMAKDPKTSAFEESDPPLPDLGEMPSTSNPNASLANDFAALLNSFSTVFASHPELSEGMRNIIRNATEGTYWNAHREAVSKAAEEMRRGAQRSAEDMQRAAEDIHRAAEESAGQRVAEALGSVMRAFGQFTGTASAADTASGNVAAATSTPAHVRPRGRGGHQGDGGHRDDRRMGSPSRRETWHDWTHRDSRSGHHHRRPGFFGPRHDSFFSGDSMHGPPGSYFGASFMRPPLPPHPPTFGPGFPPPPPPPPPVVPPFSASGVPLPWPSASFGHPIIPIPPPPTPPMPPMPPMCTGGRWAPPRGPPPHVEAPDLLLPTVDKPIDTLEEGDGMSTPSTTPSTPKESDRALPIEIHNHLSGFISTSTAPRLGEPQGQAQEDKSYIASKEALQKAKEQYRKEKENYRKERQARRADRMRRGNVSGDSQPSGEHAKKDLVTSADGIAQSRTTPEPQIVSNARGTFPRIELEAVSPRRHHTVHGLGGWDSRFRQQHRPPPPPNGPSSRPGPPMHNPFSRPHDTPQAINNIMRRFSDMGFTQATNPELRLKVTDRVIGMVRKGETSREAEDAAVADVLEELLAKPSAVAASSTETQAAASGSGESPLKRSRTSVSVPGSWD
ncbi:hypothetical protein BC835DRAFT_1498818 [Cytidiella melzeri]|nr:hypothetical protein BC835DRAFT_1498818 [Cytidiella melzeri]